jgi:hypothetical protein
MTVASPLRLIAAAAAAAALALAPSGASAQSAAGGTAAAGNVPDWRQGRYRGSFIETEYFEGFSRCVALRWPDKAEALLATVPNSREQSATAEALMSNAGVCLFGGYMRMQPARLRGSIAEALIKMGRTAPAPAWLSGVRTGNGLIATLLQRYSNAHPGESLKRELSGRGAAYCTVQESRPLVEALFRTASGSVAEQAALIALNPTLSGCLGRRTIVFETIGSVRAYLAEALYWQRGLEGSA